MSAPSQLYRTSQQAGFTLLEIMVVIVILGLLVAVVAPNVLQNQDKAMVEKAKADLAILEQSLDLYKLDNFVYPSTDQGLEALLQKPDIAPIPKNYANGGYIKRLPEDPWGNAYLYLQPGSQNQDYALYSTGADGETGGEGLAADIRLH